MDIHLVLQPLNNEVSYSKPVNCSLALGLTVYEGMKIKLLGDCDWLEDR